MGDWQPIDTAPWSGPPVLLWKESTREHYVAARVRGAHGPGWCTPDGYEILRPTHWMPLPAAPVSSEDVAPAHPQAADEQKQSDKARIERLIEQLTKKRIQISDYIAGIDPTTGDHRRHALTIAEGRLLQIDMDIEAARALTRANP